MLVDTHAHVQLDAYDDNREAVLTRARDAGVTAMVAVGVDVPSSRAAVELAASHADVYATVGLHPHDAVHDGQVAGDAELAALRELAARENVVAIGECGLDYYYNNSPRPAQLELFRRQLALATELDLPMVWHVRDAFEDFFNIVDGFPGVRGIVHCFTGTRAEMQAAVDRGFLIAYNGIMTFTKQAEQLEAVKATPLGHIVLETDCPWLAPKPHRGAPNEPAYLVDTAHFLADLRGEGYEEFCAATSANAATLLGVSL